MRALADVADIERNVAGPPLKQRGAVRADNVPFLHKHTRQGTLACVLGVGWGGVGWGGMGGCQRFALGSAQVMCRHGGDERRVKAVALLIVLLVCVRTGRGLRYSRLCILRLLNATVNDLREITSSILSDRPKRGHSVVGELQAAKARVDAFRLKAASAEIETFVQTNQ